MSWGKGFIGEISWKRNSSDGPSPTPENEETGREKIRRRNSNEEGFSRVLVLFSLEI